MKWNVIEGDGVRLAGNGGCLKLDPRNSRTVHKCVKRKSEGFERRKTVLAFEPVGFPCGVRLYGKV